MTRTEFREKWGPQWSALIAGPMWGDAIATAETEIGLFRVAGITDEQIERHGHLTLKAMQAHNKLELTLATLAVDDLPPTQLEVSYPDPVKEADAEARRFESFHKPTSKPRKKKTP